jgi:hypothetical protein
LRRRYKLKIDMNKDFEKDFKSTIWKGLGGMELLSATVALLTAGAVAIAVWYFTRIPPNVCIYMGIPIMLPIAAMGFVKYQGASLWELVKNFRYFFKTSELPFEAEEHKEDLHVFTMASRRRKERR